MQNIQINSQDKQTFTLTTLQDELTGALIGLARTCNNNPKTDQTDLLLLEGLSATAAGTGLPEDSLRNLLDRVKEEKYLVSPGCATCTARCGNTDDYDMALLRNENEEIRNLKLLLLAAIRGMAGCVLEAMRQSQQSSQNNRGEIMEYFYHALSYLAEGCSSERLLPFVLEAGKIHAACRKLSNA